MSLTDFSEANFKKNSPQFNSNFYVNLQHLLIQWMLSIYLFYQLSTDELSKFPDIILLSCLPVTDCLSVRFYVYQSIIYLSNYLFSQLSTDELSKFPDIILLSRQPVAENRVDKHVLA